MSDAEENPLRPEHFQREDESPDPQFYVEPRFVTHIDDGAIAAATLFYSTVLPPGGEVLDLMSSWVSHLPTDGDYAAIAGLGMNEAELERNPQLTERTVHDLNANPELPFEDGRFDGAVCTVSVQYLLQPAEVFAHVARVLKPGAPFVVTYSNRCFPTKAVAAWRMLDDKGHADLIGLYFQLSGGFDEPQAFLLREPGKGYDPLYAVVAGALREPLRRPPLPTPAA